MPIPQPTSEEAQDDYVSRCMSDATMVTEYPNAEQRVAVCHANFSYVREENADEKLAKGVILSSVKTGAAFKSTPGNVLDVEVFAIGKWNGLTFSKGDLAAIASAFHKMKEFHKVPLKFGHNDEQQMTDGFPALGWVDDIWVDNGADGGEKLFAKFVDMPDPVMGAIGKKLYRKVSIELEFDVRHKDNYYPLVLTAVALLGADLPAVNTIADLTHYMSRDSLVKGKRHAEFSAINFSEDNSMDEKEIQALKDKLEIAEKQNATLTTTNAQFTQDNATREAAEKTAAVSAKRTLITGLFSTAVKDMKITPAQSESFSKLLKVGDDDAVMGIEAADVTTLIEDNTMQKGSFSRSSSGDGGNTYEGEDPGDALTEIARGIQDENQGMKFTRALDMAMRKNPEMATAHVNATCEEA